MTTWCADQAYKLKVKQKIDGTLVDHCAKLFKDYRILNQVFIIKKPGPETTFHIHQDWNVVDERKFPSLNIWIPLVDVNESSGAMWIIKKSHHLNTYIRGAGSIFPRYNQYIKQLSPYMTSYPMKAGEALIFYHSTIHGSPPNLSNQPRIVIAASILPKEAPLHIHYHQVQSKHVQIYQPGENFMFEYESLREDTIKYPPKGELKGLVSLQDYFVPTAEEIIQRIN